MAERVYQGLIAVALLLAAAAAGAGVFDELEQLGKPARLGSQREFLPPDEAFRLSEAVGADGRLELSWDIAPGYYLYRDKLRVTAHTTGVALGAPALPPGEWEEDPEFGRVEIYYDGVTMYVPVESEPPAGLLEAEVRYQGCAKDGICYPPIKKTVGFDLAAAAADTPAAVPAAATAPRAIGESDTDRITRLLGERSLALTMVTFLGLGLLLSFTPCVLPMVPILSGIIVGQRQPVSTARALLLSTVYVLAMAATYTAAGVVAGVAGHNLQAAFQHPAVIASFAAVFVALALSMFGFYELALPAALQARLDRLSRSQRSGTLSGVAAMGVLSAVIVGPCVAPPLAGALAYIGQTGSPVVGAAALFALGLGMGLPLIAIGASAGTLLPRAGAWMERVKQFFGVVFLGVAVWFLERILPAPLTLALWAALAIGCAVFLGAL
ncbi:MAG: protein-disulfide reductase DsbD, partial [Gammaproteobacteria bacterium]